MLGQDEMPIAHRRHERTSGSAPRSVESDTWQQRATHLDNGVGPHPGRQGPWSMSFLSTRLAEVDFQQILSQ